MIGAVQPEAAAAVWPALLELRRHLAETAGTTARGHWLMERGSESWVLGSGRSAETVLELCLEDGPSDRATSCRFVQARCEAGEDPIEDPDARLDPAERTVLRLYLPLILGAERKRREGGLFVCAHLAQTLDGRIACSNGHSHWISNEANLHHAHRLRALHDSVVVGGRTVLLDDPQLTVRHVPGEDPVRIVLSASGSVLAGRGGRRVFEGAGATVLCRPDGAGRGSERPGVTIRTVEPEAGGWIGPESFAAALLSQGLQSAFVEGGGRTLSTFLEHSAVDVLYMHLAPLILGSGVASFSLPEALRIQDAHRFSTQAFLLDGELLLECRALAEERG